MSKAAIRLLKVLSIIVWLSVTFLGFIAFYNLSHATYDFGKPQSQLDGVKLNITIPITLRYDGYLLPLHIKITFRLEDVNNGTLAQDTIDEILNPGETKNLTLKLFVDDATKIDHGRLMVYVAQLLLGKPLISMTLEQVIEVGLVS